MSIKTIQFAKLEDLRSEFAQSLKDQYVPIAAALGQTGQTRLQPGQLSNLHALIKEIGPMLELLEQIDRNRGEEAQIDEGADQLVQSLLIKLIELASWGEQLELKVDERIAPLVIGVGYWAMRHDVAIHTPEPIAHMLGILANAAPDKSAVTAVFGMTQGFIEYLRPSLGPDLEQSNPERPWRVMTLNLAICAIRAEEPEVLKYGFDQIEQNLPMEAHGFFQHAAQLCENPGIPQATRDAVAQRLARFETRH
jgi:hypothetical protein